MAESPATLVDGAPLAALPLDDRALAYGDGLFETILCVDGRAIWWGRHLARLRRGADVLGIAAPDDAAWAMDRDRLLATAPRRCVLKLMLSRGSGGRGYAPPERALPRRIVAAHPAPDTRAARAGIRARWCATPLAQHPRLAGLKHLNCLDRVLARAEWRDPAIQEGLLCNAAGAPVSATSGNLLVYRDGRWWTPPLLDCGIAGVCREVLLESELIDERPLTRENIDTAEGVVVCNSVRGILPVIQLDAGSWSIGEATRALQRRLAAIEPELMEAFE